jgi:hypothetical protein
VGKVNPWFRGSPSVRLMTGDWVASVRRRALRKGVWFRVCNKLERGIMDLTIRCVDTIKSFRLALIIGRVVCKILKACRSRFLMRVARTGYRLAEGVSRIAAGWGMDQASTWKGDKDFIRYLGVNAVNSLPGWRGGS